MTVGHPSGTATGGPKDRALWLDTLRGFAALVVVFDHYVWAHSDRLGALPFDPGVFGVSVFFLISGFIIPRSVRSTEHATRMGPLVAFVVNRFFRLFPVYWPAVVFGALVFPSTPHEFVFNLTMLQRFLGEDNIIGATWTLQVEIIFYVWVCAAILLGTLRRTGFVFATTVAGLALAVLFGTARAFYGIRTPVAVPIGFTVILSGYWIYLRQSGAVRRHHFAGVAALVAALLVLTFFFSYDRDWGYNEGPWRFVFSNLLAVTLFVAAMHFRLQSRLLVRVAAFSYPIYLLHQPMEELFRPLWPSVGLVPCEVVATVATIAASIALHRLVEQPGIRLGRTLYGRRRTRIVPAVPAPETSS